MKELVKLFNANDSKRDVCRVSCKENDLCITHHLQISKELSDVISKKWHITLKDVRAINPHITDFGTVLEKKGEETIPCAILSIVVNIKHNSIEELVVLADFARTINFTILDALKRDIVLKNISLDMAPFDE